MQLPNVDFSRENKHSPMTLRWWNKRWQSQKQAVRVCNVRLSLQACMRYCTLWAATEGPMVNDLIGAARRSLSTMGVSCKRYNSVYVWHVNTISHVMCDMLSLYPSSCVICEHDISFIPGYIYIPRDCFLVYVWHDRRVRYTPDWVWHESTILKFMYDLWALLPMWCMTAPVKVPTEETPTRAVDQHAGAQNRLLPTTVY